MVRQAFGGWRSWCVLLVLVAAAGTSAAQTAGDIVLYAADVSTTHGRWAMVPDTSAAIGLRLEHGDEGWSTTAAPLAAPDDYVDFSFTAEAATPYRVWLRLRASGDSKWNDSVWVQFSNAQDAGGAARYRLGSTSALLVNLATDSTGAGLSAWGWQNGAYWLAQATEVSFPSAGPQTLRVQTREDGVQLDQIVLSPVTYFGAAPGLAANDPTIVAKPPALARTVFVPEGGHLQAALDAAQPGDTILLQPGAVYAGSFILGAKNGDRVVTLRTAPTAGAPGEGGRITPADAPALATIRSGTTEPAMQTEPGAHHWRVMLLEFQATAYGQGEIVRLGDGSPAQHSLAQVPHDLVLDRVYIHGDAANGQKRGVALNSAATTITGSYIADIKSVGQDSQAIAGWNGPGPYQITNNYLEASGENILFGGADPSIPNLVPSNITIADNHVAKQPSWRGGLWSVKNLLELKNARHVSVVRNTFEYTWQAAQAGYAILFTVRNQGGACPWCQVAYVRFEQNVVRHSGAGFQILGTDNIYPSLQTHDIEIRDNLINDIDPWQWGGNGYFLTLTGGPGPVTIDHNTIISDHASGLVQLDGSPIPDFRFTDNLARHNAYGFIGTDHGVGNDSIAWYLPGATIAWNVLAGANPSRYPANNAFPSDDAFESNFVSYATGDYRLVPLSTWLNAGDDGRDLGAAPTIPGTIEAEHFDEGGEGTGYHDTTAGNAGGAYRPSDVDIQPSSEGGYNVGWIGDGEWLNFSASVATAGTYAFEARVAAPVAGAVLHLEANGRDLTGPLAVPATGGWQSWTTITVPVALDAGPQILRLVFDREGANVNWIRFDAAEDAPPVGGAPVTSPPVGTALPGTLQAANYDAGGEGVGYHDDSQGNAGGQLRADDVDIESSSLGGYDVGWIASGEWLAYTVNVASAGSYQLTLRVASPYASGRLHATLGGSTTATAAVPNTGGWQNWTAITLTVSGVPAGEQTLRLQFDAGGFNVADIAVAPAP